MTRDPTVIPYFHYLRDDSGRWSGHLVETIARCETVGPGHYRIALTSNSFEELSRRLFDGREVLTEAVTRLHNHFFLSDAVPPERIHVLSTQRERHRTWIYYEVKEE